MTAAVAEDALRGLRQWAATAELNGSDELRADEGPRCRCFATPTC
ncbi:hypothetical protein ABZV34_34120 [Streptomyces sp. NPDC005195]